MNPADRSKSGGRSMLLSGLFVLLLLVAFGFAWRAGLVREVTDRRAALTPVLTMDLPLDSQESHSRPFFLKYSGRYKGNVDLEFRHGPQGAAGPKNTFSLRGSVEIFNAVGGAKLEKKFSIAVDGDEVRVTLFEFETKDIGIGEKRLVLFLTLGPDFSEHYAKGTLHIQKVPGLAVTY